MSVTLYRIGYAPATTLQAQAFGSTLFAGRWHSLRSGPAPRRVIYVAASRALAQLEKRVHANGVTPINQALFALILPADVEPESASAVGLPVNWRQDMDASQAFGDRWLDRNDALALWVPSSVEPSENNCLINPAHPRIGEVTLIAERDPFEFDPRLV